MGSERQVLKCSAVPGCVRDGLMSYLLPHSVANLERSFLKPGVVVYACDSSSWKGEVGGSEL